MPKVIPSLDLPETTILHSQIIYKKPLLKKIYTGFYEEIKSLLPKNITGKIIELGSGGGFIKEVIPEAITSDVMQLPMCDMQFSVEKMPFKDNTVAAFVMLNTFHHFKDAKKALLEMQRCLKSNGKIIMIEPYNSIWGRLIYKNTHHEPFNPDGGWKIADKGPLSGANGALPWIVFERDLENFELKFPKLKLIKNKPHTPLLYLLSGGLSKPQLIPLFFYPLVRSIEKLLSPVANKLGMFTTIEIVKR